MRQLSLLLLLAVSLAVSGLVHADEAAVTRVPVVFSGGHDTDPRDGGRPVILVASALGVPPEVFRETFTHVHPAGPGSGGPTPDEARANKRALLDGLAKYGVTNERLDEVSNYYRYMKSQGQMWTVKPAQAVALVKGGAVTGYEIVDGGAGYSTPPAVTVPGVKDAAAVVSLSFGTDLAANGAVSAIAAVPVPASAGK